MKRAYTALTILVLILAANIFLLGCMSTNPTTGAKEYDPVKTEQVKACFKPLVTGTVASLLQKHPEYRPAIVQVQAGITNLVATNALTPLALRGVVNDVIQQRGGKIDPLAIGGIESVLAGFEFFYASRARADLPENLYVQHISDTLAQGMAQGLAYVKQ